jgi:serine/threonine-protein kinase
MTNTQDLTGCVLGGYRILRKLGQGGMATVYKAHEESLNRVVALKVIGHHLSDQPEFIERFRREAQAAAQLSHPNIIQIHAIGEDDGVHFFSMEYVKGESLGRLIERNGFLTAERAVPIVTQVAQALAAAHEARIVHRDIKPANIILDLAGRVKVADFGIAQMLTGSRLTQSGAVVGTPEYVSPEQCRGETLDGRSDIYALGVTCFQMVTGRPPFDADSAAALVLQIVEGQAPAIDALNPTVPAAVREIVAKMMDADRERRFQTAEDVLDALEALEVRSIAETPRTPLSTVPARGQASPDQPSVAVESTSQDIATREPPPAVRHGSSVHDNETLHANAGRRSTLAVATSCIAILAIIFAWNLVPTARPDEAAALASTAGQTESLNRPSGLVQRVGTDTVDPSTDPTPGAGTGPLLDQQAESIDVSPPSMGAPVRAVTMDRTIERASVSAAVTDPQSDPAPSAAAEDYIEAALPPQNSVIVTTSGQVEYVDLVHAWIEATLVE